MGKRPEAHLRCYTGITYSIKSTGQADRLLQLIHALRLSIALVRIGSCPLNRMSDCRLQTLDFKFVASEVFPAEDAENAEGTGRCCGSPSTREFVD
jgi:hypothetical protein